jgi:hypothetical protein
MQTNREPLVKLGCGDYARTYTPRVGDDGSPIGWLIGIGYFARNWTFVKWLRLRFAWRCRTGYYRRRNRRMTAQPVPSCPSSAEIAAEFRAWCDELLPGGRPRYDHPTLQGCRLWCGMMHPLEHVVPDEVWTCYVEQEGE